MGTLHDQSQPRGTTAGEKLGKLAGRKCEMNRRENVLMQHIIVLWNSLVQESLRETVQQGFKRVELFTLTKMLCLHEVRSHTREALTFPGEGRSASHFARSIWMPRGNLPSFELQRWQTPGSLLGQPPCLQPPGAPEEGSRREGDTNGLLRFWL